MKEETPTPTLSECSEEFYYEDGSGKKINLKSAALNIVQLCELGVQVFNLEPIKTKPKPNYTE